MIVYHASISSYLHVNITILLILDSYKCKTKILLIDHWMERYGNRFRWINDISKLNGGGNCGKSIRHPRKRLKFINTLQYKKK